MSESFHVNYDGLDYHRNVLEARIQDHLKELQKKLVEQNRNQIACIELMSDPNTSESTLNAAFLEMEMHRQLITDEFTELKTERLGYDRFGER